MIPDVQVGQHEVNWLHRCAQQAGGCSCLLRQGLPGSGQKISQTKMTRTREGGCVDRGDTRLPCSHVWSLCGQSKIAVRLRLLLA